VSTNPKREEIAVDSVKSLLRGEIPKEKFVEKLKNNNMPLENLNRELRNFESSH